jgi:hypothetical protein
MEIIPENSYAVAQLGERYGISKQAIINRRKFLGINTFKVGNKSYISEEDLEKLDSLHQFLMDNPEASMQDFQGKISSKSESTLTTLPSESSLTTSPTLPTELVEAIAPYLQLFPKDPCWNLTILERARDNNWLLTTTQVQALIGTKPRGDRFPRANWVFIKKGKWGRESCWAVMKDEEGDNYKV